MVNLHRLAGGPDCGLADSIEVLADGDPLPAIGLPEPLAGFVPMGGFDPAVPPPDAPGTGTSAQLWGSRTGLPDNVGQFVSPWFALPAGTAVSVSVAGRTDGPNALTLEFGRADGATVNSLGAVAPADPPPIDDGLPTAAWRSIGVDAARVPPGTDRVRVNATDGGTSQDDWLAVTGPRTTNTMPLNDFLAGRSPTLVSWPLGFLFPCVEDIAPVAHGVAQMPRVILVDPYSWFTKTNDESLGGTFAAALPYGRFHEVRSRVVGHPELRWGTVLVSAEPAGGGVDDRHSVRETPWGLGALPRATSTY
jgi:arabinosyltransferase C